MPYTPIGASPKSEYTPITSEPPKKTPETPPPPQTQPDAQLQIAPPIVPPAVTPKQEIPFGALSVDDAGNPYYGTGLLGWIRTTYADLFDPKKRFANLDMSNADWQAVDSFKSTVATEVAKKITGEDNQILGLSTGEVAQVVTDFAAPVQIAQKNNKSVFGLVATNSLEVARDLAQRTVWGALEVLGVFDTAARKVISTDVALVDLSKDIKPDSVLPEIFGHRNSVEAAAIVAGALMSGKIKWGDVKEEMSNHQKASAMVYSMIWDDMKRKEFEKQLAEGKDPGLLAQSLANPIMELAGSLLFDISNYFGMGIPTLATKTAEGVTLESARFFGKQLPWRVAGRIPEFGEILSTIGIKTGEYARRAAVEAKFFTPASEELANGLEKALNAGNDSEALKIIQDSVPKFVRDLSDRTMEGNTAEILARRKSATKAFYQPTALRSTDAASLVARDMSMVAGNLLPELGVEKTINALRDGRILMSQSATEAEKIAATKRLLTIQGYKGMLTSPAALETYTILGHIDEKYLDDIMRKFADDPHELGKVLFSHLSKVVEDVIPSVDNMEAAAKKVKNLYEGVDNPKIIEARKITKTYAEVKNSLSDIRDTLKELRTFKKSTLEDFGAQLEKTKAPLTSLLETKKEVIKSLSDQIKDLKTQITAIGMSKDKKLLNEILSIQDTIDELQSAKKLEASAFSAKAEQLRQPVLSMQETIRQLVEKVDGKIKDVETQIKAINNLKKDTYAALKDITIQGKSATEFINGLDKIEKLARMYEDVPEYVKVSNKIANAINKVNGPLVGLQVNIFLKPSPGYFVRNIEGQTGLIAMSMGIGHALEIAGDTVGNSTEARSLAHSTWAADELKKLGVLAPSDIWKGIGAVGDTKGGGMLGPAQAAERVASARIILDTTVENIRKVGPALARKELDGLVANGGVSKQYADLLMGYLDKFDYNQSLAIPAWRKEIASGVVKDWQNMPIPKDLREPLRVTGNLQAVLDAQMESKTAEEFIQRTDEIFQRISDEATKNVKLEIPGLGQNVNSLDSDTVEMYVNVGQQARKDGNFYLEAALGDMGNRVQAYANARYYFDEGERDLMIIAHDMADKDPQLAQAYQVLHDATAASRAEFSKLMPYKRSLLDTLWKLNSESYDGDIVELWGRATIGRGFSLAEMFPNVKPDMLTPKDFRSYMWEAFGTWSETFWREGNNSRFDTAVKAYDEFFKAAGTTTQNVVSSNSGNVRDLFTNYEKALNEAKAWEQNGMINPKIRKMLYGMPFDAKLSQAEWDGFQEAFGFNVKRVFNSVNADRRAAGLPEYATFADVPFREAVKSAAAHFTPPIPPPYNGGNPSMARAWFENLEGMRADFKAFQQGVVQNFNRLTPVDNLSIEAEASLGKFAQSFGEKMAVVRAKAVGWGVARRDFLLFDYRKTYLDMAYAYIKPFGYWSNKAYETTAELLLSNPKWASRYLAYKQFNEREHSNLPQWWKESVGLNLPGVGNGPLFLNLEANINPIYSLTGTDFEDSRKRVDWLSRFVDDTSQIGGQVGAPINWAVALWLQNKGETDAAARWRGRLIPGTRFVKSVLNADISGTNFLEMIGADQSQIAAVRYGEIDPFVASFDHGVDAYEQGQVANALAAWIEEGVTEDQKAERAAQATDAVYQKSGEIWDMGVQRAIDKRAPGAVMSFFGGPGYKQRTPADVRLDNFYNEYNQLIQSKDLMDADQYRAAWDKMRKDYPEMDTLIIGKKGSDAVDSAYAYTVLGRVPPGDLTMVFGMVGIDQARVDSFYENKGDMTGWGQGERDQFMGGIAMLSAVLKMPNDSTREEWTQAKSMYKTVEQTVSEQLGMPYEGNQKGIWDLVQSYYDLLDTDPKAAESMKELAPIQQAIDLKKAYISNTPELFKYYGSLDVLQSYFKGKMMNQLTKQFGKDIYQLSAEYSILSERAKLKLPGAAEEFAGFKARNYAKLQKFWSAKDDWQKWVDQSVVRIGSEMPSQPKIQTRLIANPTPTQQAMVKELNAPKFVPPEKILANQNMRPEIVDMIKLYLTTGQQIPTIGMKRIQYTANDLGLSVNELMQILGVYFSGQ